MQGLSEMTDPVQAILGVKTSVLIAGLVGGAVSSVFSPGPWWQHIVQAGVGAAVSVYGTPFAVEVLSLVTKVTGQELEHGAAFICGLCGMAIVGGIINYARAVSKRPESIFNALKKDK